MILAVPVAPPDIVWRLEGEADELRVLHSPSPFAAVGQWYGEFPQVSDERVVQLLPSAQVRRAISEKSDAFPDAGWESRFSGRRVVSKIDGCRRRPGARGR